MTDCERFGYRPGAYAYAYAYESYMAAGWGEPPSRYWIDADETKRRLKILNDRYASIGIGREGRRHSIDFAEDLVTVG
jgi:hypothetical protein